MSQKIANMSAEKSDLFKAGMKNRREVVGDKHVDNALKNGSNEFAYPCQELITE